jgi:hypothetical protein
MAGQDNNKVTKLRAEDIFENGADEELRVKTRVKGSAPHRSVASMRSLEKIEPVIEMARHVRLKPQKLAPLIPEHRCSSARHSNRG